MSAADVDRCWPQFLVCVVPVIELVDSGKIRLDKTLFPPVQAAAPLQNNYRTHHHFPAVPEREAWPRPSAGARGVFFFTATLSSQQALHYISWIGMYPCEILASVGSRQPAWDVAGSAFFHQTLIPSHSWELPNPTEEMPAGAENHTKHATGKCNCFRKGNCQFTHTHTHTQNTDCARCIRSRWREVFKNHLSDRKFYPSCAKPMAGIGHSLTGTRQNENHDGIIVSLKKESDSRLATRLPIERKIQHSNSIRTMRSVCEIRITNGCTSGSSNGRLFRLRLHNLCVLCQLSKAHGIKYRWNCKWGGGLQRQQ